MSTPFDNASGAGFLTAKSAEVHRLDQALNLADGYELKAPGDRSGGSALAVENLDRTLKIVTFGLDSLTIWKDIAKERITQLTQEYNVQSSYGVTGSPFFQMGQTPEESLAKYDREVARLKYLGTYGQVMHDISLITGAHGDVVGREVKNKTIELLQSNERQIWLAENSIQDLEYDGIQKQIEVKSDDQTYKMANFAGYQNTEDSVIFDARKSDSEGGQLDPKNVEKACLLSHINAGAARDLYLSSATYSDFSTRFFEKQRLLPGQVLSTGHRVKTHAGILDASYKPSSFLLPKISPLKGKYVEDSSKSDMENNNTVSFTAAPALEAAGGHFEGASQAYQYQVAEVTAKGERAAVLLEDSGGTDEITVEANNVVNLLVKTSADTIFLNLYRSKSGEKDFRFIKRAKVVKEAATVVKITDDGSKVPGTSTAFLMQMDPDVVCWKQLGPLMKFDIAVLGTAYRWLQLLYGTPLVMAPRKNVIMKNLL